jgi:hypothetical protein
MSTSFSRPARSRPTTFARWFASAFGAFGLFSGALVLYFCGSWVATQSYVPVQAQVLASVQQQVRSSKRSAERYTAHFAYQVDGRNYTATTTNLDTAPEPGTSMTAWVDPAQPEHASLSREGRWGMILLLCVFAWAFGGIAIGVLTLPVGPLRRPVAGTLIAAEHGAYACLALLAGWWTLLAAPLAAIGLSGTMSGVLLPALALILFGVGLALAGQAWRLYQRRRALGTPVLERLGGSALRIHVRAETPMKVGLRQVLYTQSGNTRSEKTAWERVLKDVHGAGPFEIDPAAPGWPAASSKAWPGYWELTLVSPGQQIAFRYAP